MTPLENELATVWDLGGMKYDIISKHIADAINHCIIRLEANCNDKVLDIATGTGWTTRQLAKSGIEATGIDFSYELIKAAKKLSKNENLDCTFYLADAEDLPFKENEFDKIISTFGIIFCQNPEKVVHEIARVCKSGGGLALTAWTQDSTIYHQFEIFNKYTPKTKKKSSLSPFLWGSDRKWVESILNPYFEVKFEEGQTTYYAKNSIIAWELISSCYGPAISLIKNLDGSQSSTLKKEMVEYFDQYKTELGIAIPRKYKVITGIKR